MSEQMIPTPSEFAKYTLEKELGRGGMGGVYLGRDNMLDRQVAIKVMQKRYGADPTFVERFKKEAQAAAKLSHPNIAQIYEFDLHEGQPYIAMELVSGGSLDKKMAKTPGQLDPSYVMRVGLQIAEALGAAAERGLVHGDVKPENILFSTDGTAKLVDFGLAAMQGDTGEIWGTPYYISPEKVRRQKVDYRADIYSLGGTLYHALTGAAPFEGDDATEVVKARFNGPPPRPSEIREGLDPKIDAIVMRMLELEPAKRYPTYDSLKGDIGRYLEKAAPSKTGPAGAGRKVVIKGRGGTAMIAPAGSQVQTASPAQRAPLPPPPPPKNVGAIVAAVAGGVVALIALVALLLWWFVHSAHEREAALFQREVVDKQAAARTSISTSVSQGRDFVAELEEFCGEAVKTVSETTDRAVALFRDDDESSPVTRDLMVPPPPAALLAALNPKPAGEGGEAPAAAPAEPAETPLPEGLSPTAQNAIGKIRELWKDAYVCSAAVVVVRARLAKLDALEEKMKVLTVEDKKTAEALGKLSIEASNALSDMRNSPEVSGAQRKKGVIKTKSKSSLERIEKDLRDARKAAQARADDEEAKRRAAEEAERKAAEHAQKVEEEIARVDEKFESLKGTLLKHLECEHAIGQLKLIRDGRDGLTTGEAKSKLDTYVQGLSFMVGLLDYFEKELKDYKFPDGSTIRAAKEKRRVEITPAKKGAKKTVLAWDIFLAKNPKLFNELIKDFVERGMMNDKNNLNLRLSVKDWSAHMLGSALVLRAVYAGTDFEENACKRAEALVRDAVQKAAAQNYEVIRSKAVSIFPDIDLDAAGGSGRDDEEL